ELDTTAGGTITSPDVSAMLLDEPFSSLSETAANNIDLNWSGLEHVFQFHSTDIPANRSYINVDSVQSSVVQIVEQGTLIPMKGYEVSLKATELRINSQQKFTGMKQGPTGTNYSLSISSGLQSAMGTPLSLLPLTLKTVPTS